MVPVSLAATSRGGALLPWLWVGALQLRTCRARLFCSGAMDAFLAYTFTGFAYPGAGDVPVPGGLLSRPSLLHEDHIV
jgi:hypothetical protein